MEWVLRWRDGVDVLLLGTFHGFLATQNDGWY
jgi:hypothetical protein